jgi:hypothetical protein
LLHSIIDVLHWYTVNTHKEQTNLKGNLHKLHDNKMPSASMAKMAETTVYDAVRATPLTHIHGRLTRNYYETLKKEASDLASQVDNITFDWAQDTNAGDEYGLLTKIIGEPKHTLLMGIQWVKEVEPAKYDPAITAAAARHTRK